VATEEQIAEVRQNTNEPTEETFDDVYVESLIDSGGVEKASAIIWRKKAAKFAELVDVEEAGARHDFSDLQKNALKMAEVFDAGVVAPITINRTRVKVIERN